MTTLPAPSLNLLLGPSIAKGDQETAVPSLVAEASGVVLELGPGIGSQLTRYDKSKITKVYGVEPCSHLHEALRKQVKESGLDDIYEIVPYGIEDVVGLKKHGIALGTFDSVLSVQVLCSVPDPNEMMRRIYALMKPTGQLIVYEHVKSTDSLTGIVQSKSSRQLPRHVGETDSWLLELYNVVWPFFVGDCHLDRNTEQSIMQAGNWGKNQLTLPTAADAWTPFPRIQGRIWKKE